LWPINLSRRGATRAREMLGLGRATALYACEISTYVTTDRQPPVTEDRAFFAGAMCSRTLLNERNEEASSQFAGARSDAVVNIPTKFARLPTKCVRDSRMLARVISGISPPTTVESRTDGSEESFPHRRAYLTRRPRRVRALGFVPGPRKR
jgi:hypothetical protein